MVSKEVPTVLYLHGNAGNIGGRLRLLHELFTYARVNILALDYRGYGQSEGEPSESGLEDDAWRALMYLQSREDLDPSRVFVFGRSLGGAVAVALAARVARHAQRRAAQQLDAMVNVKGVVLENTFTSVAELAVVCIPLLSFLGISAPMLSMILNNQWKTRDRVLLSAHVCVFYPTCIPTARLAFFLPQMQDVNCAVCLLAGLQDELIPHSQMQELHEICRARKYY